MTPGLSHELHLEHQCQRTPKGWLRDFFYKPTFGMIAIAGLS